MIPASAYASGPNPYFLNPTAIRGSRAEVSHNINDTRSGNLASTSANVKPGRALAYQPTADVVMNAAQPILGVTSITAAFTAADFAGILPRDLWQERRGEIAYATDVDTQTVEALPGTLIPRVTAEEIWVEVSSLAGVVRGAAANVLTAVGPNQGMFAASGGVALTGVLVFTGRTATVGGLFFAVVRYVSPLIA